MSAMRAWVLKFALDDSVTHHISIHAFREKPTGEDGDLWVPVWIVLEDEIDASENGAGQIIGTFDFPDISDEDLA